METIGSRVRREREEQRVSRAALAKYAGIAPSTLSDLEHGRSASSTALHKIAERLGVTTRYLETGKLPKRKADGLNEETFREACRSVMAIMATTGMDPRTHDVAGAILAGYHGLNAGTDPRDLAVLVLQFFQDQEHG